MSGFIVPDDFQPGEFLITERDDGGTGHWAITDARRTKITRLSEAWIDPTRSILVHVARACEMFPEDGWHVSHAATGSRICGPLFFAAPAFSLARKIATMCDWGDWNSIVAASPKVLLFRAAMDAADAEAYAEAAAVKADGGLTP